MDNPITMYLSLAKKLAEQFSAFSGVEAVAIAGSAATSNMADSDSDIDLYVYTTGIIPLSNREAIVRKMGASRADLNLQFWDLGDEWYDAQTGIEVDVIYWDTGWIEDQVKRVLEEHQASMGYTACFWGTVKNSLILYDHNGWLRTFKKKCNASYPEELRSAVIAKNHPVLREVIPAYLHQIEKAVKRNDLVSINHRVAALLASYFDVIFALNWIPNPGEKRLVAKAQQLCEKLPKNMVNQVEIVLQRAASADDHLVAHIHDLIDGLDALLIAEGFEISPPQFPNP